MSRNSRRRLTARRRIAARPARSTAALAQAPTEPVRDRSAFSFRLLAGCALLFGLAFIQDPGFLAWDTKFDLVTAPADLLGRALHLWDGQGAFGQLQNQAYGYLWPMGPFFVLGWLAAIPGWVVQRLWWGLVMSVAFTGTSRVARALGVRSDLACIVAGVAFALSPRMLTTLGPISIEAWPSAIAPWVLLPLIRGSTRGSPRRAAALSALAVAMVGGVNAAATLAVLPLGALWLLTRTPGPRRRSLMLWWPVFTALGTLWWLVPLAVMGSYSPPFLDFIETASVTTFPTTLFDTLRGTSDWVPYVDAGSRAGNDLLVTWYLCLNSGVVLLLGFAGLLDRRNPHRQFLALAVLVGVLMVTAGHLGSVQGWFAPTIRDLLDGSLAPLRNVHKFDPILRLPLVLGLAFVLDHAITAAAERRAASGGDVPALERLNKVALLGMAIAVVAGASLPALAGRIAPAGATLGVPQYWQQAADWLAAEPGDGTALVVPGAPFGDYVWGSPKDEPLQWLARSRWAVRNVIPLAPPGNIRMLDAIEARFAQGEGSAGFADYLRRAGVRYLVVRNDLARSNDVPDPVLVHQTIARSPGLTGVATFGPTVGGDGHLDGADGRVLVNGGWQARYAAIEIFEVTGDAAPAVAAGPPPLVVGGPEDLLDLADLGVIGDGPTQLAADTPSPLVGADGPDGRLVLTDGLRARERFFARVHDGYSAALTPGDVRRSGNPSRDYLLDSRDRWSTTVRLDGAQALSASSSMSDSNAFGGAERGLLPYAAVDGSQDTFWRSGAGQQDHAWWAITFDEPIEPTTVTVSAGAAITRNETIRVRTPNGVTDPVVLAPGDRSDVELPAGGKAIAWLRVEDASPTVGRSLTLAEVDVPGVEVERTLVLPEPPKGWGNPDTVVLRADRDARTGCVEVGFDVRCVEGRAQASEEPLGMRRLVTLAGPASYDPTLTVQPRAGAALDQLVLRDQPVAIAASSVGVPDPRAAPVAAIDGNPDTAWVAESDQLSPVLTLSWLGTKKVRGLRMTLDPDTDARLPASVRLSWPGGSTDVSLADGRASFPPIRTDQLRIQVLTAARASNLGFDAQPAPVAIGIGELRLDGVPYLPLGLSADETRYPCGSGPEVTIDGRTSRTSVLAAPAALAAGVPVRADLCSSRPGTGGGTSSRPSTSPISLAGGDNLVEITNSSAFVVGSLVLDDPLASAAAPVTDSGVDPSGPVTRTLTPGSGDVVVELHENSNPGWAATQDGKPLDPVTLDGWQQGWVLADDTGDVHTVFAPDRTYRAGLVAGLLALFGLVVVVLLTRRSWAGPNPEPVTGRRIPVAPMVVVGAVGAGLVAGWPGLVAAAVTTVVAGLVHRRAGEQAPWVFAVLCLVASLDYVVTPWASSSGWAGSDSWPHYLVLVPLVGLFASAVGDPELRRTSLRRIAGRSTRR
ncbi:MAG: aftD [Nocardioides sp.]|nr:aftD [Nocardioides sp.]